VQNAQRLVFYYTNLDLRVSATCVPQQGKVHLLILCPVGMVYYDVLSLWLADRCCSTCGLSGLFHGLFRFFYHILKNNILHIIFIFHFGMKLK
jgi:hypothetical protein